MSNTAIPASLPPKEFVSTAKQDFTMDDAPDPESLHGCPLVHAALSEIKQTVWPVFMVADSDAIRQQHYHRLLARIALSCGAVAVVSAILQLAIGVEYATASKLTALAEIGSLFLCITAVVFGIITARQRRWLIQRHIAQRCRHLMFQSLTWPSLWNGNLESWKSELAIQLANLRDTNSAKNVHAWLEYEPLADPASFSDAFTSKNELVALKDYYRIKRLDVQINYFSSRAKDHERRSHSLHRLPIWCFFGSVLFATAHFSVELTHVPWLNQVGHWCIVGAAALPVMGAGIRSWLLAFEFSRSASLFRAKARTLTELREKLAAADGASVLQIIWHCETFLEEEHRDWLRLVREAEWFG